MNSRVNRQRLTLLLAALIIPGGLIALVGGWLLQRASQTDRGRKVLELARAQGPVLKSLKGKLPGWLAVSISQQAA